MQRVGEIAKERMGLFDSWVDYRTVIHLEVLRKEMKVKAVSDLEQTILTWTETDVISEALQRREFIDLELRECVLR